MNSEEEFYDAETGDQEEVLVMHKNVDKLKVIEHTATKTSCL